MSTKNNDEIVAWTGWPGFASFMLLFLGFFHIIEGVADRARQALFTHSLGYVWVLSFNKWGWLNIIGGILLVIAALTLIKGGMWGRVFAGVVVVLSMLVAATAIPLYPIWSEVVLLTDVVILFAITVHDPETK